MSNLWVKGQSVYAEWLKTLTKEEYDAHLLERKHRKSMRKAMETVVKEQQAEWIALMHNAGVVIAQSAIDTGDVQAFTAVWDRIIGKPKDIIEVDKAAAPLVWNDNFDDDKPEDDE